MVFLLVGFIKLPESARDTVVELVSTVGLGCLVIVHVKLFKIHPALVIVPSLLMILIVVLLTSACARSSKLDLNRDFTSGRSEKQNSQDRDIGIVYTGDFNSSQPPAASHQLGKDPENGMDACSTMNAEQEIRGPTVASSGRLKTRKVSVMENIEIVNKRLLTEEDVASAVSPRGDKKEEDMKIISRMSSLDILLLDILTSLGIIKYFLGRRRAAAAARSSCMQVELLIPRKYLLLLLLWSEVFASYFATTTSCKH
jgi:hypothetical protein